MEVTLAPSFAQATEAMGAKEDERQKSTYKPLHVTVKINMQSKAEFIS